MEKIITCPNCNDILIISELNCCIFRHGIYKKINEQIDPHLSKLECTRLFTEKLIFGCGKPFRIIEPKANEPKTNEPNLNEPKANEPKANEPKANEPPANDPIIAVVCDYI